jgi:hypothetical protein
VLAEAPKASDVAACSAPTTDIRQLGMEFFALRPFNLRPTGTPPVIIPSLLNKRRVSQDQPLVLAAAAALDTTTRKPAEEWHYRQRTLQHWAAVNLQTIQLHTDWVT